MGKLFAVVIVTLTLLPIRGFADAVTYNVIDATDYFEPGVFLDTFHQQDFRFFSRAGRSELHESFVLSDSGLVVSVDLPFVLNDKANNPRNDRKAPRFAGEPFPVLRLAFQFLEGSVGWLGAGFGLEAPVNSESGASPAIHLALLGRARHRSFVLDGDLDVTTSFGATMPSYNGSGAGIATLSNRVIVQPYLRAMHEINDSCMPGIGIVDHYETPVWKSDNTAELLANPGGHFLFVGPSVALRLFRYAVLDTRYLRRIHAPEGTDGAPDALLWVTFRLPF